MLKENMRLLTETEDFSLRLLTETSHCEYRTYLMTCSAVITDKLENK